MMKYCNECGNQLIMKHKDNEYYFYCNNCDKDYFELYNIAVSMIVKSDNKYLLIKQYNKDRNILVAGYVNKGESLEEACKRELFEETHLNAINITYNMSKYFARSNTLMVNFIIEVDNKDFILNYEVDEANWFDKENVVLNIAHNSLAEEFLLNYIRRIK